MNCQHGTFVGEMCSLIPFEPVSTVAEPVPVPVGAQPLSVLSVGPQDSCFKKLCCAQCYVSASPVQRRAFCTVQLLKHMQSQVQPCKRKRSEERSEGDDGLLVSARKVSRKDPPVAIVAPVSADSVEEDVPLGTVAQSAV